ncbi:hypothetical protein MAR_019971 [Mya arenaria]|uniref:Uncharacterized protein n=1 Tax=Mya arenaria TaxID=6604 RepID=A0ABY7E748_MYAAR|nr:hypothetical protein MAR_019971 [Mya arenaria]
MATTLTPTMLTIRRDIRLPADVEFTQNHVKISNTALDSSSSHVRELKDQILHAHWVARDHFWWSVVDKTGENKVFLHDNLKAYQGRSSPKWAVNLKREI